MDEVNWLKQNTGKEPALVGLDFMHSGRAYSWYNDKEPITDAKNWYNRNGIPAIIWHWHDPSRTTEEFHIKNQSHLISTTFFILKIPDENSAEYRAILADIDYVAGMLKELQDQRVPVVWRPLHEAAGGWFGGVPKVRNF
ncbi:glycoside hydrolase family 26 protein [Pontibacter sp. XAAS-A31]|nr:glycoside hydrolase family 26 protein [Pontibacter harenae]